MTVNAPFAECELAELHLADSIQPFGALLAIDPDGRVAAASANTADFVGVAPELLVAADAATALPAGLDLAALWVGAPRSEAEQTVRLHVRGVVLGGRPLALAAHVRAGRLVVELQEPGPGDVDLGAAGAIVQRLTDRLEPATTPSDVASVLMDAIADLTGFDRTMTYRFLPEWHGEVLDERLAPGMESYRGLRFPAGDIPPNARSLYARKRQRIIADARATPVPLFGARPGLVLDLAGSELRAVHPVHLEYLANMGVRASFSVSIVVHGRLWGMIACHHRTPRTLGLVTRQACEMAATIASLQIANLERAAHLREVDRLQAAVARAWSDHERQGAVHVPALLPRLREVFGADAVVARWEGEELANGAVPEADVVAALRAHWAALADDAVHARSRVLDAFADDAGAVRTASGTLLLPLGGDDHVALLRAEQVEHVAWAGRPPDGAAAKDGRLGPRASFATWREATRGQAEPWSAAAIEVADAVRRQLLEERARLALARRASTDGLTGLANRAGFEAALRARLAEPDRRGLGLLLVDLDGFKEVNDRFGHLAGDRLLELVGERLRHATRDGDLAARIGGDEFGVLLRGIGPHGALARAAGRVVEALGAPYQVGDREVRVSASVGATFARPDDHPDAWFHRADVALYAAKEAGKDRFVVVADPPAGG